MLRVWFFVQIALRCADGFCRSVAGLLHLHWPIPNWNMTSVGQ
ncbi:MAG: hypothetical protein OJF48_003911 [Afipia sp.]|nr:MAG: hypothetical protein OJF48_003911 [Afipia sp.]